MMLVTWHFHRFPIDFTGNSTHLLQAPSHLCTSDICWPVEENDVPWPMLPHQRPDPLHQQGVPLWSYRHDRHGHGAKKTVCLASLLLLIKSCCETESFWKLAEYQCRVQIYLRVYVDVFMFSIELSRETWRKFHTFTVWPNFASKTSVNLAQPEDSSKVNARCLNVSLDNILKL